MWDTGSIGYDVIKGYVGQASYDLGIIFNDWELQHAGEILKDEAINDLKWDTVALMTPFVPAGISKASRVIHRSEWIGKSINISNKAWKHVIDRHTLGSGIFKNKSKFFDKVNLRGLVKKSEQIEPIYQKNSQTYKRIIESDSNIGYDIITKKDTNVYTIITDKNNNLVTMHPGKPRNK